MISHYTDMIIHHHCYLPLGIPKNHHDKFDSDSLNLAGRSVEDARLSSSQYFRCSSRLLRPTCTRGGFWDEKPMKNPLPTHNYLCNVDLGNMKSKENLMMSGIREDPGIGKRVFFETGPTVESHETWCIQWDNLQLGDLLTHRACWPPTVDPTLTNRLWLT